MSNCILIIRSRNNVASSTMTGDYKLFIYPKILGALQILLQNNIAQYIIIVIVSFYTCRNTSDTNFHVFLKIHLLHYQNKPNFFEEIEL